MRETERPLAEGTTGSGRSRLFTVRIWSHPVGDTTKLRGSVRDVATGAFRSFREWSGLTSFLVEQLEQGRPVTEEL